MKNIQEIAINKIIMHDQDVAELKQAMFWANSKTMFIIHPKEKGFLCIEKDFHAKQKIIGNLVILNGC